MYKIFAAGLLIAASALCVAAPAYAATGPNLITNPSLESGGTTPTGWYAITPATGRKFTYPVAGADGVKAARIDVTTYKSGDIFWMPPNAPVTAGKQYQFSGYSRSNVPLTVIATYLNAAGTAVSYATLGTTGGTSAWTLYSATITVPSGATQVRIQHVLRKVGFVEVDNYSLGEIIGDVPPPVATTTPPVATTTPPVVPPTPTTTPPVVNSITNGNFEAGSTGAPTGWSHDYWGSMKPVFTYPVAGRNSAKAAQITVTNFSTGAANWIFTHIPSTSHTMYSFSEDYLSTAPTEINIEIKMADGSYTYQWLASLPAAPTWTTYKAEITLPPGAQSFTILHILAKNGTLTIDNAVAAPIAETFPSGMLTFAFDDGLLSQYQNAAPVLKSAGLRAGFYIITAEPQSGDSGYMTWTQIKSLATQGFEIGAHTRTHPALADLSTSAAQAEIAGSYSDLQAQGLLPYAFVYPLGSVNDSVEAQVKAAGYTVARGSYFGQNTPIRDPINLYDIRVDQSTPLATIEAYVDQAKADKRWLILELHDVKTGGDEYSITPTYFQSLVTYVKNSGIPVVTLKEGRAQLTH